MTKLNVREAIAAHVAWKVRLGSFLAGKGEPLDPRRVGSDTECVLGQWIHGADTKALHDRPEFQDLKTKHAAFHRRSGEIASRHAALDTTYDALSSDVVAALVRLRPLIG
ncbi:MAG: CZB domain-containing protein [Myxococcales bacterium]|nr:CZB domain-containing protein [Myxococcales bacterium]